MTHYSRRQCLSGGRILEQSAARRQISSDSSCFPESTQNIVLSFVHALTDAYTPFSVLADFT